LPQLKALKRYLKATDFTAAQTWALLAWCNAKGGDEFRLSFLSIGGSRPSNFDLFDSVLAPFAQGSGVGVGQLDERKSDPSVVQCWQLTQASIAVLKSLLPEGLFQRPSYSEEGWLEDLVVLRAGNPFLAIVSSEGEAVLELSSIELHELESAGVVLHGQGSWI